MEGLLRSPILSFRGTTTDLCFFLSLIQALKKLRNIITYLLAAIIVMLTGCSSDNVEIDRLLRSRADALNKVSFTTRYNNAALSETYARQALSFIDDSLPDYHDGRLRAWNNLATSFFNRAIYDSANTYIDSVLFFNRHTQNFKMEGVLANLLRARMLQRQSDIAGCYQILYDIEQSGLLSNDDDNILINLAKSEFYIATTTLNYHYRNKSQYQQAELLVRMEQQRDKLHCDYAEDMSFNYAIAYGYYALCSDSTLQKDYLAKALHYCSENIHLLNNNSRYSTYHLANTYQMLGFMLWSPNINQNSWTKNSIAVKDICDDVNEAFAFDVSNENDTALAFLREAAALFFLHDDPYQRLGALIAIGRYCLACGDTLSARDYFNLALSDSSIMSNKRLQKNDIPWETSIAPKFEAMLYEGLLTAGCASDMQQVGEWTQHELKLLNFIKNNERADFILQQELSRAQKNSITYLIFTIVLALLAIALLSTLLLLRRRTKALQRETLQLQKANQRDVERIANVETCLSVLRHDITPFVSYLQNDRLPDELRKEVTGQLLRTFENIKNWTKLSIPSGLQFRKSVVCLNDVFDNLSNSIMISHDSNVTLSFEKTDINVSGDKQLIEIMLRNLVNNALQHTTEGSVSVKAVPFNEDNRFAHISVSDTGCGMNDEQLENLFHSDKKIKSTPDVGYGSGFGLMLCRHIIKLHDDNTLRGCRIWAESKVGEGSIFHIVIEKC